PAGRKTFMKTETSPPHITHALAESSRYPSLPVGPGVLAARAPAPGGSGWAGRQGRVPSGAAAGGMATPGRAVLHVVARAGPAGALTRSEFPLARAGAPSAHRNDATSSAAAHERGIRSSAPRFSDCAQDI